MKRVFVMAVAVVLSGASVTMAQTKKPMKHKMDSSMSMQDTTMKKKPMKPMKKKPMKPMKDSMM